MAQAIGDDGGFTMILQLLNVLIGLTLVYLIFSTIASALFELIEGLRRERGRLLAKGLKEILRTLSPSLDADLRKLYEHPLINSLFEGEFKEGGRTLPSYIPAERFARAVLMLAEDAAGGPQAADDPFVRLKAFAERLVGQRALAPAERAESYAQALEAEIVRHFDASMDRVTGWFARYARGVLFAVGLLLAVIANVDTIQLLRTLSMDPLLADRIAESAAQYVDSQAPERDNKAGQHDAGGAVEGSGERVLAAPGGDVPSEGESAADAPTDDADPAPAPPRPAASFDDQLRVIGENRQLAESLGLALGWQNGEFEKTFGRESTPDAALKKLIGLLLTGFALSFGASFWFDLLSQFVSLRSSLKPGKKAEDQAEDGGEPAAASPKK